jgi:hypothetical protein
VYINFEDDSSGDIVPKKGTPGLKFGESALALAIIVKLASLEAFLILF